MITQQCFTFRGRKSAKEKGPEKKGRDPGLQGTEGGSFGSHPLPSGLKQRNNGIHA